MVGVQWAVSLVLLGLATCQHTSGAGETYRELTKILEDGVKRQTTPGAVGVVGNKTSLLYFGAVGNYTYGALPPNNLHNPPVHPSTLFDLASCSKIVGATTALALLYQQGKVNLDDPVSLHLGDAFNQHGKEKITILNCLLHNAGYPPDPDPFYYSLEFACPETVPPKQDEDNNNNLVCENKGACSQDKKKNPAEVFTCQEKIYNSLLAQQLQYPVGGQYIYSDLSFITLMNVVGSIAKNLGEVTEDQLLPDCVQDANSNATFQCYFEAFCRLKVWPPMEMHHTGFLPRKELWPNCTVAENSTDFYFKGTWQGQVSDENTYAMGGISGHAGVFSTALDLVKYARQWLFANDSTLINTTTSHYFRSVHDPSFSSRALGFNTCRPKVPDECWTYSCGTLAPTTFMHIGYTGTEVCMDPERQIFTILLTNRVYPTASNHSADAIHTLRYNFNSEVQKIYDESQLIAENQARFSPFFY
eukprot:CAMPEP_0174257498 /NCGR_PEP_ID=MMETSP0439-20130205/6620_1 /TAXON_ID=0 /ORGANISM="Stereomyxa ramosa, Strain Chinc5" /LENGTH=473 /DNA_ID=CAMNT_0015340597 /DNA_START=25 /DNA_END=1444 /DNA_ORIENTATION=+